MKKILLFLFIVLTIAKQMTAQVNVQDSLALVDLYNSTDGTNWTRNANWLTGPVDTWEGVTVQGTRVARLHLEQANLSGTLPPSIGSLTQLTELILADNNIMGEIPATIGNLENLGSLALYINQLSGNIPASLGNLSNLEMLELSANQLSGEIPVSLGNLTKMSTLILSNNQLTGTIPAAFANFTEGSWIFLDGNKLTGPIPAELCALGGLWILRNNQFTFDGLECLHFYDNAYTNQKQLSITNNNPLLSVYAGGTLSNNTYYWSRDDEPYSNVTGDSTLVVTEPGLYRVQVRNTVLPELVLYSDSVLIEEVFPPGATIHTADSLALVDLYNATNGPGWYNNSNWLTAPANTWFGITVTGNRVTQITLIENNLTGYIPPSIGNLTALKLIELIENYELSGTIPTEIGSLTKLEFLGIGTSKVSGVIPESVGNLINLVELYLWGNQLSGTIPESLGNLSKLQSIFLDANELTGTIPASIGELPELSWFSASGNQLSGPLPAGFCDVPTMTLNHNQFTFDGLECINLLGGSSYNDQKQLSITNNNPQLSVYAGGTLSNNTYTWYKDNGATPYAVIAGDSTLTLTEPGTYWAKVNNSILTALTLFTDTIIISQIPSQDPLEFSVEKCGRDVCMTWFAKQDHKRPISYFEVERSSDNNRFRKIDRIKASKKNGKQRYAARDYLPAWGNNYYRIKQINIDGSHRYSKVVKIELPKPVIVYIWPNPADHYIHFKGVDKAKKVTLYSLSGQIIKQWQNVNAYQPLNISSVRRGLYVVKVIHASGEAVQLIIIK